MEENELWDVYDAERRRTGATMKRGEPFPPDGYHLFIHVCLFNARGELLLQRRQTTKAGWPGKWDISASGSALAGEDSAAAAERELFEELGLRRCFRGVRPHLSASWDHGFDDIYVLREEPAPTAFRLQAEEVASVRWASRDEAEALLDAGEFVPYYRHFLGLLFDLQSGYGCGTC